MCVCQYIYIYMNDSMIVPTKMYMFIPNLVNSSNSHDFGGFLGQPIHEKKMEHSQSIQVLVSESH